MVLNLPHSQLASGHPLVSRHSGSACVRDSATPMCGHAYFLSKPMTGGFPRCVPLALKQLHPWGPVPHGWGPGQAGAYTHSHVAETSCPSATREAQVLAAIPGALAQTGGGGGVLIPQFTRALSVGALVQPRQRWPLSQTISCCHMAGVPAPVWTRALLCGQLHLRWVHSFIRSQGAEGAWLQSKGPGTLTSSTQTTSCAPPSLGWTGLVLAGQLLSLCVAKTVPPQDSSWCTWGPHHNYFKKKSFCISRTFLGVLHKFHVSFWRTACTREWGHPQATMHPTVLVARLSQMPVNTTPAHFFWTCSPPLEWQLPGVGGFTHKSEDACPVSELLSCFYKQLPP